MAKSLTKILSILLIIGLNWTGLSAVLETVSYFSDTEISADNVFTAGTLDFSLNSTSDFSPATICPGQSATKTIEFLNLGNLPKYTVSATSFAADVCDYFDLTVSLDGTTTTYTGSLKNFSTGINLFSDPDIWTFTLTLHSDAPANVQGQTCDFKFVFYGSQEENDLPLGQGFNDTEEINNTITACTWQKVVINKVYYDPDEQHSGNGPEKKYEWIELYNATNQNINLKKWEICNKKECAKIDNNIIIPSLGYALIVHDAEVWKYWEISDEVAYTYTLSGNFEMDDTADMLTLKNESNTIIDQMNWGTPTTSWDNYNSNLWNPGVPDAPQGHMLARVPSGFDTDQPSDWRDLSLPTVNVIWPNGGETLYVGDTYTLRWNATNPNGSSSDLTIDLWYSNDRGHTWAKINTSTEANDGVYDWRVPLFIDGYYVPSHHARIKVVAFGPENFMVQAWDMSDADFCPPIDYSMLTEEEKAQVEQLLVDGIITEADIINRETTTTETTENNPIENPIITDGIITTQEITTTSDIGTTTDGTSTPTETQQEGGVIEASADEVPLVEEQSTTLPDENSLSKDAIEESEGDKINVDGTAVTDGNSDSSGDAITE